MTHPEQRPAGSILVSDVFGLDILQGAGLEVVAGSSRLSREVTWVHSGEIPDIATFLRGGELLLTAGTGMGTSGADQRRFVNRLAEAGASGLLLELGRAFKRVPWQLQAAAERHGLPTAVLHEAVAFAEVTRTVHGWIIGRADEIRERAQRITDEFNELLLSGGSAAQVVHKLHELTGKPIVLEDAAHQPVEYAGADSELDQLISEWGSHSRLGHRADGATSGVVRDEENTPLCAHASVILRGELWGRLHVVGSLRPVHDIDLLAVQRASAAVGLALLASQQDARLAERARADFLAEATSRAPGDPTAFLRQARSLGADLRGRNLIAMAVATVGGDTAAATEALMKACAARQLPTLSSSDTGQLLSGVAEGSSGEEACAAADEVCASLDGQVSIGVSRPTPVVQVDRAFAEAHECLRYGRVSTTNGVLEYSTLGLHLLLAKLADRNELSAFVETELGAVLDHDAKARSPLLPTLEVLLAHGNNRAEAARALHVERRSLYYRIQRLEAVLAKPLDDYNIRLGLGVALRALNLMEDRVHPVERAARTARSKAA